MLPKISTFFRDGVILTERSDGRISRRNLTRDSARFFATLKMTRDVWNSYYIIILFLIPRQSKLKLQQANPQFPLHPLGHLLHHLIVAVAYELFDERVG